MSEQTGAVEAIFLAEAHGEMPHGVSSAIAHPGRGLEGDRHFDDGEACNITLIEAEALERLSAEYGVELRPGESRRQVVVRGIDLGKLIGRRFQVGEAECEGEEHCEPCQHLVGLVQTPLVLQGLLHSGLRASVIKGGAIRVGDPIHAALSTTSATTTTVAPGTSPSP
jgi:MOSC domain-containing protein YiiM